MDCLNQPTIVVKTEPGLQDEADYAEEDSKVNAIPNINAVKSEPVPSAWSRDEKESGDDLYSDIDISHSDIKTECLSYSSSSPQHSQKNNARKPSNNLHQSSSRQPQAVSSENAERETTAGSLFVECSELFSKKLPLNEELLSCSDHCNYKSHSEVHIKRRAEPKVFPCPDCKYKSATKSGLMKHSLVHVGEKPKPRYNCSHKSSRKRDLLKHLMMDTGEKQYSCSECTYKCIRKETLTEHVINYHGERLFACVRCSYKCSTNSGLKRHMICFHKVFSPSSPSSSYKKKEFKPSIDQVYPSAVTKLLACLDCSFKCSHEHDLKCHVMLMHTKDKSHFGRTYARSRKPEMLTDCKQSSFTHFGHTYSQPARQGVVTAVLESSNTASIKMEDVGDTKLDDDDTILEANNEILD